MELQVDGGRWRARWVDRQYGLVSQCCVAGHPHAEPAAACGADRIRRAALTQLAQGVDR